MKVVFILFHCNSRKLYPQKWINECIQSVKNQTYKDFGVIELNYGGEGIFHYPGSDRHNIKMDNYAEAMNYLLDVAFLDYKCDAVANINLDDYYTPNRLEKQLVEIKRGFDIVSSSWYYINVNSRIIGGLDFNQNSLKELEKTNVIGHPVVVFSRNFWLNCSRYRGEEIPREDWDLWIREYKAGKKFKILPERLMYHRRHDNNSSRPR